MFHSDFLFARAEPHYGWADVVGDSTQLLSIKPLERPPGVFPDFGSSGLPLTENLGPTDDPGLTDDPGPTQPPPDQ